MLSITTDYATSIGDPSPYLRRIADAGFTHLHWCHQWNTDFLYSEWEVDQIECWLNDFGLQLLDLHASVGPEKNWYSGKEYERLSGVELVKNRIDMTSRLGGGVIIMHIPKDPHCVPLPGGEHRHLRLRRHQRRHPRRRPRHPTPARSAHRLRLPHGRRTVRRRDLRPVAAVTRLD